MASEMLYPVTPVYLKSLGYSVMVIGILEGFAEAIAGLSKGYFGNLSDVSGKRVPFVRAGYFLSAVSKPIMGWLTSLWIIFTSRTLDRFGKGIRTGARDAMLADASTLKDRGKVFGFHRALDTIGAVLGPLLALLWLHYNPGDYANLFIWALIPGAIAVGITFFLKEKGNSTEKKEAPGFFTFLGYWKKGSRAYRRLVISLLVFALVNSSDVFLLLVMKERGLDDTFVIGIYIFYNLVYALVAIPAGWLGDRLGLKNVLIAGLFLFAIVYGGMSVADEWWMFGLLMAFYGMYAAATEGISKALITQICKPEDTATAIGTFTAFQSVAALIASTIAGWIWFQMGAEIVFIYASIVTLCVAIWMVNKVRISQG